YFSCSLPPPDLHSFPTRRSSDLLFLATSGFLFTASQPQVFTEAQATRSHLQRTCIHDTRTALGKLSLAPFRKSSQEIFAGKQFEDGIPQKLQAFIVPGKHGSNRLFSACRTQFGDCRAMGERSLEKLLVG